MKSPARVFTLQNSEIVPVDRGRRALGGPVLTLTSKQMVVFDSLASERFEKRLGTHLLTHFPMQTAGRSADALQQFIRRCISRASAHGLGSERDSALWAGIALLLGEDFVDDPACGWAREILADPFIVSPALRADLLHERAREHLKGVEGAPQPARVGARS